MVTVQKKSCMQLQPPGQKVSNMKKFRELKEEVSTPPIGVRSLYTKMYAKHGGTVAKSKDAQSKAYAEVEKKHGKDMRNSLEAFHKKNMNEAVEELDELSNEFLHRYKEKAADDARAADAKGDFKRGDKRFSGIINATKKQFANRKIPTVTKEETEDTHWSKSGKEAVHRETGKKTYEYREYKKGEQTGRREYRDEKGKSMGEEVEQIDEKNVPTSPEKWARAKAQAKAKFDVYPCVPLNSLAIRREGAVKHDQLQIGDEILTYNMKLDKMEWKPVLHKHYYENAPLLEIGKPSPSPFYFRCTPNHKWVISSEDGIELVETKDLTSHMQLLLSSFRLEDHDNLIKKWSIEDKFQEQFSNISEENKKEFTISYYKKLTQRLLDLSVDERKLLFPSYMKYHSNENVYMIESNAEDVWCPTTENETWVMLQNGIVTITGNSAYANGWAAKKYKEMGGGWKSVNEENYEVTVMHTTKDGDKGEHTHTITNADSSRHAKNIALQRHEKMLKSKNTEIRGMATTTAKMVEAKEDDVPFKADKAKKVAIAGKYGAGYSTARHIARQAMQRQVEKLKKKPIKEESKKVKIIKDVVKKDKFESEPIISKTVDDKES